jgi:CRP-like cAMP-binding protein
MRIDAACAVGPSRRFGGFARAACWPSRAQPGREIYLLLDGVIAVSVDGTQLAELGPGAVLGERAMLEQGLRTSTLRAVTDCVVAATDADNVDQDKLRELGRLHHREDTAG